MLRFFYVFLSLCGIAVAHAQNTDVRLKPNDQVKMEVFEEADLATRTRILKSGEVVFPLIGPVKIAGLSLQEATTRVRELYAKDYLVEPKVSLTVEEYAVEFIDILGSVTNPGRIPLPSSGQVDLSTVLASAGGLTRTADRSRIELVRADGSRQTFTEANLKTTAVELRPGDRILTYENPLSTRTLTIRGQVRRPGSLRFPLEGKLDLVTAITLAGDLTDLANPKKITVTRGSKTFTLDFRELTSDTSKRFMLEPDDIVTVPERLF